MVRCGRTTVVAVGAAALCGALGQAAAADRIVEGDLVRVDLGKRLIVLAPRSLLAQIEQVVSSLDQPGIGERSHVVSDQ